MPEGKKDRIVHSCNLPAERSGKLIGFSREQVGWEWMSFSVTRLAPGERWNTNTGAEEMVLVLLGGKCFADFGEGERSIGERTNVFDGLPYAVYGAPGSQVELQADTWCEFAECRVPAKFCSPSRLISPGDTVASLRGGGNASRQIVDVVRQDFPADRLIVVEVYTPSGNWSSYPPHKHDVQNLPTESDFDEIYYYRMQQPSAYAFQRLYSPNAGYDVVLPVHDGDAVLVREGYHPVVAGHGYNIYYLNFLAGVSRTLAATEDPEHVWVRSSWNEMDPRLPLIVPSRRC